MSFPRSPAFAVWLLVAAVACNIGIAWADDAQAGKVHPWVLLAVFWGAALLSVSLHYLLQYLAQAAVWAQRSWHQQATRRAKLRRRAWLHWAQASIALRRLARQPLDGHEISETAA